MAKFKSTDTRTIYSTEHIVFAPESDDEVLFKVMNTLRIKNASVHYHLL